MTNDIIGFIGLGNMGRPIAENIAAAAWDMLVHDIAGTQARAPKGTRIAGSGADVARGSNLIFLSLPSVAATQAVVAEIASAGAPTGAIVVNTSTVGPDAALEAIAVLEAKGIGYVDAPISGSTFRAREGTLAVMYSGELATLEKLRPLFESYGSNVFDIGRAPGSAQRMKLVNNAIAISSFVTISEALAMGAAGGLEVPAMLDVIHASSGHSFVLEKLFIDHVATGRYQSESTAKIAGKDIALFVDSATAIGSRHDAIGAASATFNEFRDTDPEADQLRVFPYISGEE